MKIICIGRNYAAHAQELNNPVPEEPVFFMKPDSALLVNNKPFYLPDFSNEIHHEIEIVVRIDRLGKHIETRFAHRYYSEITVGIDFTARDLQAHCKKEGKPWEIAKAFDNSAVLGKFLPLDELPRMDDIPFSLKVNNELRQQGNSSQMLFSVDEIIAYVSKFVTLKIGDLIYTGTPQGVGAVSIDDRLEGFLDNQKLFDFKVK